jgi:hypothetical protein
MNLMLRPLPPTPGDGVIYLREEEGYIEIDVEKEVTDEPIYAIPFDLK